MRPLWLRVSAFGPFAGVEEIDFRPAAAAGLFGIYGPTGSGKSSIFNAITFALFGEAAREEHDAKALRSDHAPDDLPTEVTLLFELGERRFLIRRAPEQMRPARRGGGLTRAVHRADLFDAEGISVEDAAAGASGKVIQERKVREVGEAVRALLGYGPSEFRRIVLLPQGRFEAFLSANTDDRKKILKELFDVSIHGRLAEKLKADAADARRAWEAARAAHDARLGAEGLADLEALAAARAAAAQQAADAAAADAAAHDARSKAAETLRAATATEDLFLARARAEAELAEHEAQRPETARMQEDLAALEKAARLAAAADRRDREAARLRELTAAADRAAAAAAQAAQIAQTADAARKAEEDRAEELAALSRRCDALNAHAEALRGAEDLRAGAGDAARAAEAAARETQEAETAQKRRRARQEELSLALKTARAAAETRRSLEETRRGLEDESRAAAAHAAAAGRLAEAEQDLAARAAAHLAAAERERAAAAALAEVEGARTRDLAAHLAASLAPGAPCPVCGGCEHPAPAAPGADAGPDASAAALEAARAQHETAATALRQAAGAEAAAIARREERRDALAPLAAPARPAPEIEAALAEVRQALAATPKQDVAKLEQEAETLDAARAAADGTLEGLRAETARTAATAASAEAALAAALRAVPEDLRAPDALAAARRDAAAAFEARRAARDAAVRAAEDAGRALASAEATRIAAAEAAAGQTRAAEAAEAALREGLAAEGLEAEAHAALAPRIAQIAPLRDAIAARRAAAQAAEIAARRAAEAVQDLPRPDMDAARAADAAAEAARQDASAARQAAEAAAARLEKLDADLAAMRAENDRRDAGAARLRELAALCNGENAERLDLETFALGARFDRALEAANARLGPMTSGRYEMRRQMEGESGRARRGLGIEAFDLHTGRPRPTSGLSGGEGFIHALALALGLADVVEREGGKVRLDTIFIDEGFGSLDADETLGEVLDALHMVTGGLRAVGLISHVPQVQEAAPVGFTLRKTAAGSTIEPRGG